MPLKYSTKKFEFLSLVELYEIMILRQEVFVVEQDCPYIDADGKDPMAWHVMGTDNEGRLLAYTRLLPKGISYSEYSSIGRVITSDKVRRQGAGKALMHYSIMEIKRLFPSEKIKISAQTYLRKFYGEFGFEAVGEEYLEDGIPHIAMIKDD